MTLLTRFVITAIIALSISLFVSSASAEVDYATYGDLLDRYVVDGGVEYAAWSQDEADLSQLDATLAAWAKVDVAGLSKADQKAFYINLYNAAMLQAVLKNYPLKSVKKIGLIPFSIFKKDFIRLADRKLSLDDVEKGILLKEYFDPRIHFAVNCASESCPPLRQDPYRGEHLEAQLNEQTRLFAASKRAARVDSPRKQTAYSELFKWYADDFSVENPAAFLNRYREVKLPVEYGVRWIDYDWSLNQVEN